MKIQETSRAPRHDRTTAADGSAVAFVSGVAYSSVASNLVAGVGDTNNRFASSSAGGRAPPSF